MTSHIRIIQRALRTTALGTVAALFVAPITSFAFNPNEGLEKTTTKAAASALPSTAPLVEPTSRFSFPEFSTTRRLPAGNPTPVAEAPASVIAAPPGSFVQPMPPAQLTQVESTPSIIAAPPGAFVQPIPTVQKAQTESTESNATSMATPTVGFAQPIPPVAELAPVYSTPKFPPVDAAVAAKAARELSASTVTPTLAIAATPVVKPVAAPVMANVVQGFIAPAPLLTASPIATQRPIENPPVQKAQTESKIPPIATTTVGFAQPIPPVAAPLAVGSIPVKTAAIAALSDASKDILSKFPSKLNSAAPVVAKGKGQKLAINRISPDIQTLVAPNQKIESYDAVGLSIKVQRPGLDTNFELNRAYTALSNGDTTVAAQTYKNILSSEPRNQDALFGLAATYHRLGDLDRARPYYAQLLKLNPTHREGLNNFLALVSSEAPQEALAELERLEQRNPDFSPIPAQQAALLSKSGFPEQAREKMLRAIELAPDNLTYKYNLAIMLDKQGHYADASALYRLLIDASLKGQKIPSSLDVIQKRLNFIATAPTAGTSVGG